jgi:hypothetical protein
MVDDPIDALDVYTTEELEEKFKDSVDIIVMRIAKGPDKNVEIFTQIHRMVEDFHPELKLEIAECLKNVAIEVLKTDIPQGAILQ